MPPVMLHVFACLGSAQSKVATQKPKPPRLATAPSISSVVGASRSWVKATSAGEEESSTEVCRVSASRSKGQRVAAVEPRRPRLRQARAVGSRENMVFMLLWFGRVCE